MSVKGETGSMNVAVPSQEHVIQGMSFVVVLNIGFSFKKIIVH